MLIIYPDLLILRNSIKKLYRAGLFINFIGSRESIEPGTVSDYETHMYLNTKTQYYNNHLHVGSIIPLKSIII